MMGSSLHTPVMVNEVLWWLGPRPGQLLVDATIGGAGHSLAILPRILPSGLLLGLDIDPKMLAIARENLVAAGFAESDFRLFCENYTKLPDFVLRCGGSGADGILLDAGICTNQLFDPGRGFKLLPHRTPRCTPKSRARNPYSSGISQSPALARAGGTLSALW